MSMAQILARTYDRTLSAWRTGPEGREARVWADVPCALSRTAKTAAPAPADAGGALTESGYALSLYTPPAVSLRLGDRLEISDRLGRICCGRSADSMAYESHCVTVVDIREVVS